MLLGTKLDIPYYKQKNTYYCGPAALQMVFEYFQHSVSQKEIAKRAKTNRALGTANKDIVRAARQRGFFVYANQGSTFFEIRHFLEKGLPIIVKFIEPSADVPHYAVVSGITLARIILHDPWNGKNFKLSRREFLKRWHDNGNVYKEWIMVMDKTGSGLGKQYGPLRSSQKDKSKNS